MVVLPAGNSYEARCHAVLDLAPDQPEADAAAGTCCPTTPRPASLELWLPDRRVAAQIKVKVSDPVWPQQRLVQCRRASSRHVACRRRRSTSR